MPNPLLNIDVILGSKSARDFANKLKSALDIAASGWERSIKKTTADGVIAGYKVALASGKSGAAMKQFLASNITDVYNDYMKNLRKGNIAEAEKLSRLLDKRTRRFREEADAIARAFDKMGQRQARDFEQRARGVQQTAERIDQGLRGGVSGWGGLGRGAIGRLREAGQARMGRAQNMTEAAGKIADPAQRQAALQQAQAMGKVGQSMAGAAKALGAIGATIGVIVLLVKAFIDIDNKVKEMRKSVLQTTGAMEYGFGQGQLAGVRVTEELDRMRDQFLAVSASSEGMYATTQQMLDVTASIAGAGRNMKFLREEIERSGNSVQGYVDITNIAIGYSKILGESMRETGGRIGKIAMETGLDISTIGESFAYMTKEAEAAGFQTKRFFSTVTEATSGLLYYNVRLQDAAKLLSELSQTLGETMGTKVFEDVVRGGAKTTEDALKQYYLSGTQSTRRVVAAAAKERTAGLFADISKGGALPAMKGLGINTAEEFAKAMEDEGMRFKIKEALRAAGKEELATQIRPLAQLIDAQKGTVGEVTQALKVLPPAAKLALLAQPGKAVFKGQTLDQIISSGRVELIAALEKVLPELGFAGVDPEKMNALADQFEKLHEDFKATNRPMSEFQEYIVQHLAPDLAEDMVKEQDEQLDTAQQIAKDTRDISDILSESILKVLVEIHKTVMGILELMPGSTVQKARAGKAGVAQEAASAEAAQTRAGITQAQAEQHRAAAAAAATPEERARQKSLAAGTEAQAARQRGQAQLSQRTAELAQGTTSAQGIAAARATARQELGMWAAPQSEQGRSKQDAIVQAYNQALASLDALDPDDPSDMAANAADALAPLTDQGVDTDLAIQRGRNYIEGPWLATYEGPIEFGVLGDSPYEKERAAAFASHVALALDDEIQAKLRTIKDGVISPGGGVQVVTDPADTVMAMKPGGPLAEAMRGGGDNNFNFYINGNKAEMTREIMRVLRATGNA